MTLLPSRYALCRLIRGVPPAVRPPSAHYRPQTPLPISRTFTSTAIVRKRADKIDFTQKQEIGGEAPGKKEDTVDNGAESRKGPRNNAAKTSSLRRVAVEAQRSRGFVRGRGNKRFVDPDVDTKVRPAIIQKVARWRMKFDKETRLSQPTAVQKHTIYLRPHGSSRSMATKSTLSILAYIRRLSIYKQPRNPQK